MPRIVTTDELRRCRIRGGNLKGLFSAEDCKNSNLLDGRVMGVPSGAVTSIKQAKICPSVVKDINLYFGVSMKRFQKL